MAVFISSARMHCTRAESELTQSAHQLLMSADQVFSISLTTESGIGM